MFSKLPRTTRVAERALIKGIALPCVNLGAKLRWVVNATLRPLYPRVRVPIPIVQEAELAPGPVWTSEEKRQSFAPTWVRTAYRSAHTVAIPTTLSQPIYWALKEK